MKWLFYVIILIYMLYKTVYGYKQIQKESKSLSIEPIDYGSERNYYLAGVRKSITCKGAHRNQKVEWIDPSGHIVQRIASNRVFSQEHFVPSHRTRIPVMVLVFTHTAVEDTGEWVCRSEGVKQNVSLCIIDPAEFVDTQSAVTVDRGRAITLSCQARGNPEPRLLWYRNGDIITGEANPKYKVMTKYNSQGFEGLLTIVSLESEDSGIYTCNAVQDNLSIEDCSTSTIMNITLNINYAPEFEDGNDTILVTSKENESVNLVCVANGYPSPNYRMFKENGDVLSEFSKDEIQLLEEGAKAVLTLFANASTFGQRYRCQAANQFGESIKVFALIKLESPKKPNEIIINNSTQNNLFLNVKWQGEVFFPVDGVNIQYSSVKDSFEMEQLTENYWQRSHKIDLSNISFDALANEGKADLFVTLNNLSEETEYCLRLQAFNEAGVSPWSDPVLATTAKEPEGDGNSTEAGGATELSVQIGASDGISESLFYGLFFTVGVIILAVGCMFAMRLV